MNDVMYTRLPSPLGELLIAAREPDLGIAGNSDDGTPGEYALHTRGRKGVQLKLLLLSLEDGSYNRVTGHKL